MVATLPPIPGQVPSATGERRQRRGVVGRATIEERERGYPDEDEEEAGREFKPVGWTLSRFESTEL